MLQELLSQNNRSVLSKSVIHESDHEDYRAYPLSERAFTWEALNQDFYSKPRDYKDVEVFAHLYREEELDLRPYMIERPHLVSVADRFPKVLNLFRQMQLRQLLVTNDSDGKLVGVITRQDIFSFMSL
jgi:CBS domain-containing protein